MPTSGALVQQPSRPHPGSTSSEHYRHPTEDSPARHRGVGAVRGAAVLPLSIMPSESATTKVMSHPPPPSSPKAPSSPTQSRLAATARSRGILKAMIERFSSTPLELSPSHADAPLPNSRSDDNNDEVEGGYSYDDDIDDESSAWLHNSVVVSPASSRHPSSIPAPSSSSNSRHRSSSLVSTGSTVNNNGNCLLTDSERAYLERLLETGNPSDMERASLVLKDSTTFFDETAGAPPGDEIKEEKDDAFDEDRAKSSPRSRSKKTATFFDKAGGTVRAAGAAASAGARRAVIDRRDSRLQQKLYHLHETTSVHPSLVISRMSLLLQRVQKHYQSNSIIQASFSADDDLNSIMSSDFQQQHPQQEPLAEEDDDWDPFEDVASWLGEAHGLTSDADAVLASTSTIPFKILGTYGSDTSCHPHVLSPPLMEALLNFCPEATAGGGAGSTTNLWLKYSRSRDGGTLAQLLRLVRASSCTIVAVETSTGHVLGCFTSRPWRLSMSSSQEADAQSDDDLDSSSFVWKMRHPRYLATTPSQPSSPTKGSSSPTARRSIVQQVCQESEIQVFPFRSTTSEADVTAPTASPVQSCSLEHGIRFGQNELKNLSSSQQVLTGTHLGHALVIDPSLLSGSTSTSETFGNPCLTNESLRGEAFDIVNLEVWTLTPHTNIADAESLELSRLFLSSMR